MKRSSGPRKTASNLSESIDQHLNMYAIAAGAAGIGVLAFAPSAEGKIVYTPAHIAIQGVGYDLDLNRDGIPDFTIDDNSSCDLTCNAEVVAFQRGAKNGIEAKHFADALRRGAPIGPKQRFTSHSVGQIMASSTSGKTRGPWVNVTDRFLGLKFVVKNKIHFGWARFNVKHQGEGYGAFTVTLTGYAYETIAGKPIKAGQKKEAADDPTNDDFGPGASLVNPIPDTPQPSSLGMLALGAQGVPLWQRKETQELIGQ